MIQDDPDRISVNDGAGCQRGHCKLGRLSKTTENRISGSRLTRRMTAVDRRAAAVCRCRCDRRLIKHFSDALDVLAQARVVDLIKEGEIDLVWDWRVMKHAGDSTQHVEVKIL